MRLPEELLKGLSKGPGLDLLKEVSEPSKNMMLKSIKDSMERLVDEVSDMVEILEVLQQDSSENIYQEMN